MSVSSTQTYSALQLYLCRPIACRQPNNQWAMDNSCRVDSLPQQITAYSLVTDTATQLVYTLQDNNHTMFKSALTQTSNVLRRSSVIATPRIASRVAVAQPSARVLGSVAVKRSYHEKVIDHYENPRNVGIVEIRPEGAMAG